MYVHNLCGQPSLDIIRLKTFARGGKRWQSIFWKKKTSFKTEYFVFVREKFPLNIFFVW